MRINCSIEILQIVEIEEETYYTECQTTDIYIYIYYINGKISIDITCVGLTPAPPNYIVSTAAMQMVTDN